MQQPVLAILGALFVTGLAATAWRVLRSRRRGLSVRLQVFLALATTSFVLAGASLVIVARATGSGAQLITSAAVEIGMSFFVLALVSALAATFIGWLVAGPLERLARAAEQVAAGRRQATLPLPRGREARVLTQAFASMRAELEERHQLEAFVADLSHELKNPVAAIVASAEVLRDAITEDPEAARLFVQRIAESATRLERLTSELLVLARLEAGGLPAAREPADLAAVARAAVAAAEPVAQAVGVDLGLQGPTSIRVRGDGVWLQRAIENLLANAIEASRDRGSVRIELAREDATATVIVQDSGPGVPEAVRSRLFERFATTRHDAGGTGLGLAIVRAVAEAHGGRAELRHSGERGATFALVLPAGRI